MLLVTAIVVIGIRSFFVQPFIIPTNSMYPSFSGMQPHVYDENEGVPNFLKGIGKITSGASHYKIISESKGKLYLKLQSGAPFRFVEKKAFLMVDSLFFQLHSESIHLKLEVRSSSF